jgi:phospholipid-transporting ATPase
MFFLQLLTYWVSYSHLIPISLYVSLELLKLALAILINKDSQMYHKEINSSAKARTSDLIEELGQVKN